MSFTVEEYEELAADALEMIETGGRSIILRKLVNTIPDQLKPHRTVATNQDVKVEAIFAAPSDIEELGIARVTDELIEKTDQVAIISPAKDETLNYEDFDKLVDDDGVIYSVDEVRKLKPGTVTLLYYLFVSR